MTLSFDSILRDDRDVVLAIVEAERAFVTNSVPTSTSTICRLLGGPLSHFGKLWMSAEPCRKHFEPDSRIANIDARDLHLTSPEGFERCR